MTTDLEPAHKGGVRLACGAWAHWVSGSLTAADLDGSASPGPEPSWT